ncbi:propanediol utilization protein, partial [Candidatus Parcubacteria bacterium]|nr:propanediol utilization protein [Candidatus Parcubacteria bacterium]
MQIPIEVSARHVHLTQEAVEKLFGPGYSLTLQKELSQPGTFAAEETVSLRNSHGKIANVRILGPVRDYNQIEISRTDARRFKIDPPIRDSHE